MMKNKKPRLDYNRLYVYCDFVKPGKHQYLVTHEDSIVEPEPPKPTPEPVKPAGLKRQNMVV